MSESLKFNKKIVPRQFRHFNFRKRLAKQMNISNFKNLSLAGKSNDQFGSEKNIRQWPSNVTFEKKKTNNSIVNINTVHVIPPPPKLGKKTTCNVRLKVKRTITEVITETKSFTTVGDVKESEQSVPLDSSLYRHHHINSGTEIIVEKIKPLPPPPPLLPMPMTGPVKKIPSQLSQAANETPPVEPKITKKGDTVIKSYIDERTGRIAVYEPGIKLEVCHSDSGKWYPAKVIQVDLKDTEVLIHYEKWSSRFDEWIKMDSNRLRPSANTNVVKVEFKVGEKVEAIWNTDGQRYPGVIIQVFPQDYYEVQFDDGIKCKKKSNQIFKIKRSRGRPSLESSLLAISGGPTIAKTSDMTINAKSSSAIVCNNDNTESFKNIKYEPKDVSVTPLPAFSSGTKSSPPVHFSIFTPPSGDLGKRKRTIQDYSALLKRPSKLAPNEFEEISSLDDSTIVSTARKRKRQSFDTNVLKTPISHYSGTAVVSEGETAIKPDPSTVNSKLDSTPGATGKITDSISLPAKRIRKPSRRFSTLTDDQMSLYSSELKNFKFKNPQRVVSLSLKSPNSEEKFRINDDGEESESYKRRSAKDDSLNGICKERDTSPISSTCTSPTIAESTDESLSLSDVPEDEKYPAAEATEGSVLSAVKARRRGRIQFRTKIPSDLANLDIPPPPASGYRLKKLYLEIEKVNDVNIQQVVNDPEGIIFKLNDPVPEGWRKEAQLKFRNETYPKWFISYVSPAGDRFRYLKQMHKLIQEVNFDFTPFDFRPLNPRLQEIAKLVSGGLYSYKRRTNMPPPPLLSELETSPGVGVVSIPAKPNRRPSVAVPQIKVSSPTQPGGDSKIDSGFVDAEGNNVKIEQGEDGGWPCPAQGCDKHFRKDSLLQMHLKHYHPEMKIKLLGGIKIANVVEMAKARTAFDYDEPNTNAPKVLPSLSESDSSTAAAIPSVLPYAEAAETINKKIICKKSRAEDIKEDQRQEMVSPLSSISETLIENTVKIEMELVDIDIIDNKDDDQMMKDIFTDAVEISASDYKKPRINLRRKLMSKRYRFPIRNSLKLHSISKREKKGHDEDVNSLSVKLKDSETDSSEVSEAMPKVQIIVTKREKDSLSKERSTSSMTKSAISNGTGNLRRPLFPSKRNNSLLKSILKRQMKATSLQVQRARDFVQSRRGRGRPSVSKPIGYLSGLTRKQVNRIRQYIVDNNIPIRFLGEPTLKDVKVEIINCICQKSDEFGLMVQFSPALCRVCLQKLS